MTEQERRKENCSLCNPNGRKKTKVSKEFEKKVRKFIKMMRRF